jgi:molybdate transport system substrate-binding protein
MLSVYITSLIFVVFIIGSVARWSGFPLLHFLRYFKDEILITLATCSTEAVLPRMMAKLERLGCSRSVVGLVLPTGYTFNADGTCIYLTMAAIFVAQATFACAAEIKVYATIGVKHSLEDLTAKFEKTSGHRVSITWGTGAGLAKRIQAGEQADLLVLTRQGLDTLSKDGKVAVGTERNFTSSTQAVGIRKGAPRPDISTPEAFKATILNAKSVAYPDPAGGGLSGVLFTQLAEKMGFAEQLKRKAKFPADNFAGKLVANGEAELAIQQKPELMSIEGVEILGPLPPEINVTTVFSAGVSKDAKESGPSTELLKYLESPEAAAVFKRDGFDPPPPASG